MTINTAPPPYLNNEEIKEIMTGCEAIETITPEEPNLMHTYTKTIYLCKQNGEYYAISTGGLDGNQKIGRGPYKNITEIKKK